MQSPNLNRLSPAALKAAMEGGFEHWGEWASVFKHIKYVEPANNYRRKCRCGCGGRATHLGMANGVALMIGCELSVRRWAKFGRCR